VLHASRVRIGLGKAAHVDFVPLVEQVGEEVPRGDAVTAVGGPWHPLAQEQDPHVGFFGWWNEQVELKSVGRTSDTTGS
jgi:hypothetical protein